MPRQPAPHEPPVAMTIAGSDSGGGAGIQADLKTIEAHGAFATSVVTAVTAQNTRGVDSSHVLPIEEIEAQLDAVTSDFNLGAAKTGMLATAAVVERVTEFARGFEAPLVVDPVMVAASGDRLLAPAAESAYEALVGEATVATPNADEAEVLTGREVDSADAAVAAGEDLLAFGAEAALVKGGHVDGDDPETVEDVLVTRDGVERLPHPRVATDASHGSGCALASAVAARLAQGATVSEAVEGAVAFIERAVRYHHDVGQGPGAVHHLVETRERAARPAAAEAVESLVAAFVEADVSPLVPAGGMDIAGVTPFAERADEVATVEGRLARTVDGVRPNRGVRFGADGPAARFLLTAREFDPGRRFACTLRLDDAVDRAVAAADWPTAALDGPESPEDTASAGMGMDRATDAPLTRARAAGEAHAGESPAAVLDRGEVGVAPTCWLAAADTATLRERVLDLLAAVDAD